MKKIIFTTVLALSMVSGAIAAETTNIHDQFVQVEAGASDSAISMTPDSVSNKATTNMHDQFIQVESGDTSSDIHGHAMTMSEMNEHQHAEVAHEFMKNGQSFAHQNMIKEHEKMGAE